MNCQDYIKEAFKNIDDESDYKNAVLHSLEFMAEKVDNPKYVPPNRLGDERI